jgi:hypothetical protein
MAWGEQKRRQPAPRCHGTCQRRGRRNISGITCGCEFLLFPLEFLQVASTFCEYQNFGNTRYHSQKYQRRKRIYTLPTLGSVYIPLRVARGFLCVFVCVCVLADYLSLYLSLGTSLEKMPSSINDLASRRPCKKISSILERLLC